LVERESLADRLAAYEEGVDLAGRGTTLGLTPREVEVMIRVVAGASNAEVAMSLGISRRTVEKHLQHTYARLGVTSGTQAVGKLRGLE
jgi:DNA-binding CsgD family transcriptional regulator